MTNAAEPADRLQRDAKPVTAAADATGTAEPRAQAPNRALHLGVHVVVFALFAFHVAALFPALRPDLRDIGDWDESWYVYWGYRLHRLHHPGLSANPIVGALYAVIYPLAKGADPWLVEACRLGRAFFAVASWLVLYAIVRECTRPLAADRAPRRGDWSSWLTPLLLFTASAVPAHLLATPNYQWGNPSDACFAIVSGLAFWQLLRFHQRGERRALALCSAFLGVSVLARVDGLILSALVIATVLALNFRRGGLRSVAIPALLPFAGILGTFLALYAAVAGTLDQGISSRSYQAFEEGQAALRMSIADWKDYQLHARPLPFDGDLTEVRALFGTPEENSRSVVRALLHHPEAAVHRLARTLATIPAQVAAAYGELVVIPVFALALRGARELWRKRRFAVLTACAAWVLPLGSYLLFFYRPGYFLLPFFVPFALATLGLAALVGSAPPAQHRYSELSLGAIALASAALGRPSLAAGAVLALALFIGARLAREGSRLSERAFSGAVIGAASLAAVTTFVTARAESRPRGEGAEERAVRLLRARLPDGAHVAAFGPGPVWASNPTFDLVSLEGPDGSRVTTKDELARWLSEHRVAAVYENRALTFAFPASSRVLSAAVGEFFDVVFEDAPSGVRVLVTRPELFSIPSNNRR